MDLEQVREVTNQFLGAESQIFRDFLREVLASPENTLGWLCFDVLLWIWVRVPLYRWWRRRRAERICKDPEAYVWGRFVALVVSVLAIMVVVVAYASPY